MGCSSHNKQDVKCSLQPTQKLDSAKHKPMLQHGLMHTLYVLGFRFWGWQSGETDYATG